MALTYSSDAPSLTGGEREVLKDLAKGSIREALAGRRLVVQAEAHTAALQAHRASFVTLTLEGDLRGCIGRLEAERPLVVDVVANAYSAAFEDPRFPGLTVHEFERLSLHISILSEPEPVMVGSEEELIASLRPGIDGLILSEGYRRGTFLPAVWETLPDPQDFLRHLKRKAGMPADYWSATLRIERYTTESIA